MTATQQDNLGRDVFHKTTVVKDTTLAATPRFIAQCVCGWQGEVWHYPESAQADALDHLEGQAV